MNYFVGDEKRFTWNLSCGNFHDSTSSIAIPTPFPIYLSKTMVVFSGTCVPILSVEKE
jgi:hypothetical protein